MVVLKLLYDDYIVNDFLKYVVGNYLVCSFVDKVGLICKCIFYFCLLFLWIDRILYIVLFFVKCNIYDYRCSFLKFIYLFVFIIRFYKE